MPGYIYGTTPDFLDVREWTDLEEGEPFTVEGMVVDWNGNLVPAATHAVQVELVHLEADYGYGYDDPYGNGCYQLQPVYSRQGIYLGRRWVNVCY